MTIDAAKLLGSNDPLELRPDRAVIGGWQILLNGEVFESYPAEHPARLRFNDIEGWRAKARRVPAPKVKAVEQIAPEAALPVGPIAETPAEPTRTMAGPRVRRGPSTNDNAA